MRKIHVNIPLKENYHMDNEIESVFVKNPGLITSGESQICENIQIEMRFRGVPFVDRLEQMVNQNTMYLSFSDRGKRFSCECSWSVHNMLLHTDGLDFFADVQVGVRIHWVGRMFFREQEVRNSFARMMMSESRGHSDIARWAKQYAPPTQPPDGTTTEDVGLMWDLTQLEKIPDSSHVLSYVKSLMNLQ